MDFSLLLGETGGVFGAGVLLGGSGALTWSQKVLVAAANKRIDKLEQQRLADNEACQKREQRLEDRVRELEDQRFEIAREKG